MVGFASLNDVPTRDIIHAVEQLGRRLFRMFCWLFYRGKAKKIALSLKLLVPNYQITLLTNAVHPVVLAGSPVYSAT